MTSYPCNVTKNYDLGEKTFLKPTKIKEKEKNLHDFK